MTPRDEDRDAWLALALRHAPDANADAPPALSAAILREARAAAPRPASARAAPAHDTTGPLHWFASAWAWLARPPVAAGFASVMVATLVGVMWWGQPLDETLPRAPEVVSSTPQARADVVPPAVVAAAPQATLAEPAAAKPAETSREAAARGRLADKKESERSARASRPADELPRQRAEADAARAVAAAAPPPAAFPAAPPTAPPAAAPRAAATANEAPAALAERRERAVPAAKAAAESSGPVAADSAASPRDGLRALQGSASPALANARPADAGDSPLAALRARIAQQPERWRWQRGAGVLQPMNPAVQAWLATLEARTGSRWRADAGSSPRGPANSVRLFRDGVLQATLGLGASAVWVEASGASAPPASMAALSESEADSLRQALDEATP